MHYKQDENLAFLKDKINQIKIALFKSEINSELQLPNNIIQTLSVEDDGTIWFFTTCNEGYARFMDKSFYAYLSYYKKDTGCRLNLGGKATIVDDCDESSFGTDCYYPKDTYTSVLIKMKIMQAEFFENKTFDNRSNDHSSWTDKIKTVISGLFMHPAHRIYDFS